MRFVTLSRFLRSTPRALLLAAALLPFAAPAARAQVTFNFTPAALNYNPSPSSQTVFYSATISNLSSSVVYLNDISISIDQSAAGFATPNFSPFFNNVPQTLTAFGTSGSTYSGQVFGIDLSAGSNQAFSGNAQLIGGANGNEFNPLTTLQQFAGFPAATPEPGTLALMACGALGGVRFGVTHLRRRARKKSASV